MFIIYLLNAYSGIMLTSSGDYKVNGPDVWVIFGASTVGLYLLFVVSLLILFVYKLFQVYRNIDNNEKYLFIIIKITLLNWTSFLTTIVFIVFVIIKDQLFELEILSEFMDIIDNFSNFVFVVLSYNEYDIQYLRLCKCCHNICFLGCSRLIGIHSKTMDEIILGKNISVATKESAKAPDASV